MLTVRCSSKVRMWLGYVHIPWSIVEVMCDLLAEYWFLQGLLINTSKLVATPPMRQSSSHNARLGPLAEKRHRCCPIISVQQTNPQVSQKEDGCITQRVALPSARLAWCKWGKLQVALLLVYIITKRPFNRPVYLTSSMSWLVSQETVLWIQLGDNRSRNHQHIQKGVWCLQWVISHPFLPLVQTYMWSFLFSCRRWTAAMKETGWCTPSLLARRKHS